MQVFNPYTWSIETISPQTDMSFKKDLFDAVKSVYTKLYNEATDIQKDKGHTITRVLVSNYNSNEARAKLLTDIQAAIYKHVGLTITTVYLDATLNYNAYIADSPVQIFLRLNEANLNCYYSNWVFGDPSDFIESLNWLAGIHYTANTFDAADNKFLRKTTIPAFMCLHSSLFDLIAEGGDNAISNIAETILHELGHCIDGILSSLRLAAASELGDDIINYASNNPTPEQGVMMLQALEKAIKPCDISPLLKKKYLACIEVLLDPKSEPHDEGWLATVTALYAIGVREVESRIGAKLIGVQKFAVRDSVLSSDDYKGNERRADKYAARNYASKETIDTNNLFVNAAAFSKVFKAGESIAKKVVAAQYRTLRDNKAKYDTYAKRAEDSLKHMYIQISALTKDRPTKVVKEYLQQIKEAEILVKEMKSIESELEKEYEFMDSIKKFLGRALTLFISRNRLEQNSILMDAARRVSRSSLHADAELIKLL